MTEAIQTVISELKTLSSDITSALVFRLDGETLAASESTTPEQTQMLIAGLNGITHAGCIGGLEKLQIQDINSQVSVAAIGDAYLATVSSRAADQPVIKSLTQVVVPTVIRLALGLPEAHGISRQQVLRTIEAALPIKQVTPQEPEPSTHKVLSTQFMVEKIGGLLVASDTVRIDNTVLSNWQESCVKQFTHICIETLEGKTCTCKFKPHKDGRGAIGIPDKILRALDCEQGKLVMVKPVIE